MVYYGSKARSYVTKKEWRECLLRGTRGRSDRLPGSILKLCVCVCVCVCHHGMLCERMGRWVNHQAGVYISLFIEEVDICLCEKPVQNYSQ